MKFQVSGFRFQAGIPLLTAVLFLAGCGTTRNYRWMPPPPDTPSAVWRAPAPVPALELAQKPALPPALPPPGQAVTLDLVLSVALQNNPLTRSAWATAKAAWADLGSRKSAYYPTVDLGADLSRVKQSIGGGKVSYLNTTYGPSVALNYVLFDFGRRKADAASAEAAFLAAGFSHNAVLSSVVLQVEQAYYAYLQALALRAAAETGLKDADENLKAAEERHKAGVATIADVLQARTARSQALLALQKADGQIQSLKGGLATAMGLPADIQVEVEPLPDAIAETGMEASLDELVKEALESRPDLEAARAEALKYARDADKARADAWPVLTAGGSAGRVYLYGAPGDPAYDNYAGTIGLTFPLFTGYDLTYKRLKARAEADAAATDALSLSNQVVLQVWTSYYDVRTARQQLATSRDLLASAEESEQVALERYQKGVGTILDLLSAQSALSSARAQLVQSRAGWFVALARLAHDTGRLDFPAASAGRPSPKEP